MIISTTITINGKQYTKTYSDTHYVERDGVKYAEAIDPVDSGRVYTESTEKMPELTAEEALGIITGGME